MSTGERFKLIPAVYLVLRRGNEVLLSRRTNTGYQDGNYSVVAGHLDGDEVATSGMIREAFEEAGIGLARSDLTLVHTAHRVRHGESGEERIDLFFEAWNWNGEIVNAEPEKCDELGWYPIEQLPENTVPFIRLVIGHVLDDVPFSEYEDEPV